MIVDGDKQFVGSDAGRANAAIAAAARRKKAAVRLTFTDAGLDVTVEAAPGSADLYLALADESANSEVSAGENSGHRLHHVAIARSLRKIASVKRGAAFHQLVEMPRGTGAQRIVVFLQESGPGRISGAAMLPSASQTPAP